MFRWLAFSISVSIADLPIIAHRPGSRGKIFSEVKVEIMENSVKMVKVEIMGTSVLASFSSSHVFLKGFLNFPIVLVLLAFT